MSLIKTLIGRRQFLAASVASTCALTCKKITGLEAAAAQAAAAAAAPAAGESTSAILGVAGKECPNLLSPLKIRDKILKNRIYYTVAGLYTFQGPETFPSEVYRRHFAMIARNVGVVTLITDFGKYPKTYHDRLQDPDMWSWEHISNNKWENIPATWNYYERMLDDMHYEGALVIFGSNAGDVGDAVVGGDVNGEGAAASKITGGGAGAAQAAQRAQPGGSAGPGEQAGGPGGGAPGGAAVLAVELPVELAALAAEPPAAVEGPLACPAWGSRRASPRLWRMRRIKRTSAMTSIPSARSSRPRLCGMQRICWWS